MKFRCVYCRSEIFPADRKTVICSNCKTQHHFDCWVAYDGCSVFGCGNKITRRVSEKSLKSLLFVTHPALIILFYFVSFCLFARASLILLLLLVICVLVLKRLFPYFQKVLLLLYCLSLLLIVLPIDVRFENRGTIEARILPISWGYLSREGDKEVAQGKLIRGGCTLPFHPASHAMDITY